MCVCVYVGEGLRCSLATPDSFVLTNKICLNQVENPIMICAKKCKSLISIIVKDKTHPFYPYTTTLPHGRLRVLWCRTERFGKSFLPYAIKLFNSDW